MKRSAYKDFNKAIRNGELIKSAFCQECGTSDCKINGHHADYSKPLEVEWLCDKCHGARHKGERRPRIIAIHKETELIKPSHPIKMGLIAYCLSKIFGAFGYIIVPYFKERELGTVRLFLNEWERLSSKYEDIENE